jgi:hypothetical protein
MNTFVSRKNLPLIQFIARKVTARVNIPDPLQKNINLSL